MRWMRHSLSVMAVFSLWLALPAHSEWHVADAEYRRELKVDGTGTTPVTTTTTVFLDDRHSGFVLIDSQGKSRPFSLLNRIGSRVSVYFEACHGETLYLYPSAEAILPTGVGAHSSGLLHQSRSYDGKEVLSVEDFNKVWRTATLQGGGFADNVYASFNPFGANTNTLHRYDGFLKIRKPGITKFSVASTDASFLLINDSLVASWPGKHGVEEGLDGSKSGVIDLKQPGNYRFTFLHANSGPTSYALAAMVPAAEKGHFVIGPEFFTQVAYAFVGPLVGRDEKRAADFIWENRYMVSMRGHQMYEFVLEATPFKSDLNALYQWDFGDGTRGEGVKVEHLYFTHADIPVTLTVTVGDQKLTSRQMVHVQPRYGQSENDDGRTLALLGRAVAQEKNLGIQAEGYAPISHGWFFFLREEQAADFAPRVLAAIDRIPAADLYRVMIELALGVQQVGEQYELAESCFRVIFDRAKEPKERAFAALHCGGMLNLCLNRPEDARELLSSIKRSDLDGGEQRLLDIYLADTALILDDFATAQTLYLAVPRPLAQIEGDKLNRAVIFDYNSRYFRLQNLLSQQHYRESLQAVDMIEWDIPEERASPRMNLLKVQALVGNNQPRKAVVCIQRALLAEVDETYTPKLRLQLAELYLSMNQFAQAKHQLTLIRRESPWTQEELDARKLLKVLEQKLNEEREL